MFSDEINHHCRKQRVENGRGRALCHHIGNAVRGVDKLRRDLGLRDLIAQEEKLTSKCLTFDLMSPRVIPIAPVLSVHMRGTLAAYPNSSEKNFVRAT